MPHRDRRALALLGLAGAVVALIVIWQGARQQQPMTVPTFTEPYHMVPIDDPLELLLVRSDGQVFANLARDPLLRRAPEDFHGAAEASYRAQRPVAAYAAWALSLGRPHAVPGALVVCSVIGSALAVSGCGALLIRRGAAPWWALSILVLPGSYYSTLFLLPELLALGFGAWGIAKWERGRMGAAATLLVASALTRETMLVAFAVLLIAALWRRDWARSAVALCPFVAVALWRVVLVLRLGELPASQLKGRIGAPFEGLRAVWGSGALSESGNLLFAGVFVLLGLYALHVARDDVLSWIAAAYLVVMALSGHLVWAADGLGRTMIPMGACAIVAIAGGLSRPPNGRVDESNETSAPTLTVQQE